MLLSAGLCCLAGVGADNLFLDELIYTSATALAQTIRAKGISSAEALEAYLQWIETVNSRLNAVVQVNAEAARLGRRRTKPMQL